MPHLFLRLEPSCSDSVPLSVSPFAVEAVLTSGGRRTLSASWKGLLQPSTPVWAKGKAEAVCGSHWMAFLRVLALLLMSMFMKLPWLSIFSRWFWRKSWGLSGDAFSQLYSWPISSSRTLSCSPGPCWPQRVWSLPTSFWGRPGRGNCSAS